MAKEKQKVKFDQDPEPHKFLKVAVTAILLIVAIGAVSYFVARKRAQRMSETAKKENVAQPSAVENYKKQLPALENKVKENPGDKTNIRDYAVALYASGDTEKAKGQYLAELKLNDKDPVLFNNLGNIYRDSGQYEEAINSYQKAIDLDPKSATAYTNLAHLYIYTLDKPDLGIEVYQKAIEENPDKADLKVLLGSAYEQAGDKEKARETFQSVLDENPSNAAAKAGLDRLQP